MKIEELIKDTNLETNEIEFKRFLNDGSDKSNDSLLQIRWLKTLAAFANGTGGRMYVGVDDSTHELMPLDSQTTNEQILLIRREIQERIIPLIPIKIHSLSVKRTEETLYIIEIEVLHSFQLPVMVKDRGSYTIYIRKYGYTEVALPEEIRSLVLKDEQTMFDILPTDVVYQENDFTILKNEYSKNHDGNNLLDKSLKLKGFFDESGKLKKGALLFKDDCVDPKTKVSIVKWPGIDRSSSSLLSVIQLSGPITKVINEASKNVMLLSNSGILKTTNGEIPYFSYPQRSIYEGIANAFAHRNYWMEGTQIQIDIFIDRIEITSPGSLLSGKELTKEKNISSIIPQHRNSLIANILSLIGTIQGLRTGFDKIENDYLSQNEEHKPFITSTNDYFTLVLPDLTYQKGVIDASNSNLPDIYVSDFDLNEKERLILSYCYSSKKRISEIAKKLNISVSSYLKNEIIKKLVDKGYLIEIEERPITYLTSHEKVQIIK